MYLINLYLSAFAFRLLPNTPPIVTSIVMLFHGFRSVGKLDGLLHNSVFDTSNICSAVFTLAINRLHSFKHQPFWFHSLNSMVPVKGIDLFY